MNNYLPRNNNKLSPWAILTGKETNAKNLYSFDCLMFTHNYINDQKIFTKTKSGLIIGYDKTLKIALIYDTDKDY